jgi:hypothetical protein
MPPYLGQVSVRFAADLMLANHNCSITLATTHPSEAMLLGTEETIASTGLYEGLVQNGLKSVIELLGLLSGHKRNSVVEPASAAPASSNGRAESLLQEKRPHGKSNRRVMSLP